MDLTDEITEGLLRTVMRAAATLIKDPSNYDARANLLWANSLSHNGLTGCAIIVKNNLGSVRVLHEEDMEAIYRAAY